MLLPIQHTDNKICMPYQKDTNIQIGYMTNPTILQSNTFNVSDISIVSQYQELIKQIFSINAIAKEKAPLLQVGLNLLLITGICFLINGYTPT